MKFKVENIKEFKKAVALVKQLVPKRPVNQVLGGLYLKSRQEGLSIIVNALDSWIDVCLPIYAEPVGEDMVFDGDIFKIIQNIKQPFEFDNGVIKEGQLELEPKQLDTADFPPPWELKNLIFTFVADGEGMLNRLKFVLPSASTDEFMKNLNCVNWHFKDELHLVAADGFQLAASSTGLTSEIEKQYLMNLSAMKVLAKFPKLLWTITVGENGMRIASGDIRMMIRQPEWEYPNYERILPTVFHAHTDIDRDTFLQALDIFSNQETVHIKQDDKFILHNFDTEIKAKTAPTASVPADTEGEIEVALNTKFLQGILKSFNKGDVHISWVDDIGPAYFSQTDDAFKILMPVRIK